MGSVTALRDANEFEDVGDDAFAGPACVPAEEMELATVLAALSDPIRLKIVIALANDCECTCGSFELPVAKSTKSHHLRVLGEAGVVGRRVDGKHRMIKLRRSVMDARFPGLLDAVLGAAAEV
jgi:DNA-binding transcriptional ArsR family regulator